MNAKTISRIITALDCAGVVATAVLAANEAPRAKEASSFKEKIKVYSPSMAVGALTIGGIIGLNSYHLHTERALAAAYISARDALQDRKKLEDEKLGPGASEELDLVKEDDDIQDAIENGNLIPDETKGELLCWDEESHHLFISTEAKIWKAICKLNRQYSMHGRASVNSWLADIRIPLMTYGDLYGWDMEDGYSNGYMEWIDIEPVHTRRKDGTPLCIIRLNSKPTAEFTSIDNG